MSAIATERPVRWNIPAVLVTAFVGLSLLAPVLFQDKPWWQLLLAMLLLVICLYPTVRYFARHEAGLPTVAVFGLVYAFQFFVPIFTREPIIELTTGINDLNDSDVTAAVVMAILGVVALFGGYYLTQRPAVRRLIPIARLPLAQSKAILYCGIVTLLLPSVALLEDVIPLDYQVTVSALVRLLYAQTLIAIGILGWIVYGRKGSVVFEIWLFGLVAVAVGQGIAKGVLEEVVVPLAVVFVIRWLYTGKLALRPAAAVFAIMIFLSPVKSDFRDEAWLGPTASQNGLVKATLWVTMAKDFWGETLSGLRNLSDSTAMFVGRTDLIHQLAHIHELSPAIIPFQYGTTYRYFAVAFIPRFLWPEKPEAGESNYFFATSFGLTTEEGARRSTFGVSLVGEAYINFGWFGVAGLMLICGALLGMLQHSFGEKHSGAGGQAIFLAFFVFFLNGMGTSAEIMFGNIFQNLVAAYILLMWARQREALDAGSPEPILRPR